MQARDAHVLDNSGWGVHGLRELLFGHNCGERGHAYRARSICTGRSERARPASGSLQDMPGSAILRSSSSVM